MGTFFLDFVTHLKKVTRNLCFHITLKTNDLQDIVYTTLPETTVLNVTFDNLHLLVPKFIPCPDTQVLFRESRKTISPHRWIPGRQRHKLLPQEQNVNSIRDRS